MKEELSTVQRTRVLLHDIPVFLYFILFYKILLKLFPNEITLVFKFEDYDY